MALIDNLLAYWKLDETSGTTAADSHTNAIDLTNYNADIDQAGKIGKSYLFNRSADSDHLNYAGASTILNDLPKGDFSFSVWIYCNTASQNSYYVITKATTNTNGWRFMVNSPNRQIYLAFEYSTYIRQVITLDAIPINTWNHFVVTWNVTSKKAKLYFNGSYAAETTSAAGTYASDGTFRIGRDTGATTGFQGYIDEVGIWNKELSSDEVTQLYNSGDGLAYPLVTGPATYTKDAPLNSRIEIQDENVAEIHSRIQIQEELNGLINAYIQTSPEVLASVKAYIALPEKPKSSDAIARDFSKIVKHYGQAGSITYYTTSYSGTDYDCAYTTGSATITGHILTQPINLKSATDAQLLEQGRITLDDRRCFMPGSIETSPDMTIQINSNVYKVLPDSTLKFYLGSGTTPIYNLSFIRRLPNGSYL